MRRPNRAEARVPPIGLARRRAVAPIPRGSSRGQEAMMTDTNRSKSPRRARLALASLLATTMLAGGGLFASHAWSANDASPAATAPGPAIAPLINQAGFADLAAKVKSAVV